MFKAASSYVVDVHLVQKGVNVHYFPFCSNKEWLYLFALIVLEVAVAPSILEIFAAKSTLIDCHNITLYVRQAFLDAFSANLVFDLVRTLSLFLELLSLFLEFSVFSL